MYTNPVIDAHVHVSENGEWFGQDRDASYEKLMSQMENSGVDKGLILSLAQLKQNDFVKSICEKSKGKLFALAGFDPLKQSVDEIGGYLDADCFKGIKLHPRRENFSPLDERAFPIYEAAMSKNLPVNFDVFGHTTTLPMDDIRPSVFDRLAKKFPKLKMVLSHCGAPWVMEAFFVAKSNKNVYLDCSFIISRFGDSSVFTDLLYTAKHLDQKLIYGSDFPEEPVNRYLSLAKIAFKELPEEKKSNIFGLNAARVYDLK
ncbi:MAG: amidohydrolase [bacterium]|nr:MAG: amidohydrolase [bacterium]